MEKESRPCLPVTVTLPDGYYTKSLDKLMRILETCRQAGFKIPKQNDIREADIIELEGLFLSLGPFMELACRASRYNNAEHKTDVGVVVSIKTGRLDGRASISVLHDPVEGRWVLYAQVLPSCRTPEVLDLCVRISIEPYAETERVISEDEAFSTILSIAKWAVNLLAKPVS